MIETRQMSFEDIKPKRLTKYMQILEIIDKREMTAREIEREMNRKGYSKYFDMNHVRPRLTELVNEYHELVECGTKVDYVTKKNVAVYRKATEEEKMISREYATYTKYLLGGNYGRRTFKRDKRKLQKNKVAKTILL